jgi:tetratricopeptide (TPR) repeat protein
VRETGHPRGAVSSADCVSNEWLLALLAATLVVYLPALWGVFVFDDYPWILQNHRLNPFDLWQRRPVTLLTFAGNLLTTGTNPVGFHIVNIALHMVNGALVYLVIQRARPRATSITSIPVAGAALFLLHPAQTGAVTYISGRATSLMTFWLLVAHLAAMRGLEKKTTGWTAVCLGAFALAVGSKEIALVYPAIWIAWLVFNEGMAFGRSLRSAAPQVVVLAALIAGMMLHPGYRSLFAEAAAGQPTTAVGRIEQRFGLGFCFNDNSPREESCVVRRVEGLAGLTRFLVAPWTISIDPGRRAPAMSDVMMVALAILIGVMASRTRPGPVAAGLAWAVAALIPTHLVFVRSDPVSDRLLYLPMVGVALAVSTIAGDTLRRTHRSIGAIAACALLCATGAGTWNRNVQYRSEISLWEDAVAKNATNPRAHVNLAYAYELQGEFDRAESEYREALAVQPALSWAEYGLNRIAQKREERTWR